MKKTYFLITSSIILLFLPIPLSLILAKISELELFPTFSRYKFYEEYYQLLGTFIVMIIGFWYANKLIEGRLSKQKGSEIGMFKIVLRELLNSLTELYRIFEKKEYTKIIDVENSFHSTYNQLIQIYSDSFSVKNAFSKHGFELLKALQELKEKIFTAMPTHPINVENVKKMKTIIRKLSKEL